MTPSPFPTPQPQPRTQHPNLQCRRVLGNGAFGYVFEAYCKNTNQLVAVKRTQKVGSFVSREYEILKEMLGCPNVIQMLDFYYSKDTKQRLIQNTVLEFCESSLEY
jgi:serine/threonine protein kinase